MLSLCDSARFWTGLSWIALFFPARYPQVTVKQLEYLLQLYTAKENAKSTSTKNNAWLLTCLFWEVGLQLKMQNAVGKVFTSAASGRHLRRSDQQTTDPHLMSNSTSGRDVNTGWLKTNEHITVAWWPGLQQNNIDSIHVQIDQRLLSQCVNVNAIKDINDWCNYTLSSTPIIWGHLCHVWVNR